LWKFPTPVTDAQDFLDQQVDGFGESVADAAGPTMVLTLIENDQCCSSKVTTLACSG
jgi:hypothetical protein